MSEEDDATVVTYNLMKKKRLQNPFRNEGAGIISLPPACGSHSGHMAVKELTHGEKVLYFRFCLDAGSNFRRLEYM